MHKPSLKKTINFEKEGHKKEERARRLTGGREDSKGKGRGTEGRRRGREEGRKIEIRHRARKKKRKRKGRGEKVVGGRDMYSCQSDKADLGKTAHC